jgi:hypothetical protein
MLDWMVKYVPIIQKGQRISDKCRKTVLDLPTSFGNEAVVSSVSECGNKEED